MLGRQTRRNWRRNRNPESTLAKPPNCPAKRDHLSVRDPLDPYFGGAGRSRVGCRLHHEVISIASIFSSFGPVMKRTMHFR